MFTPYISHTDIFTILDYQSKTSVEIRESLISWFSDVFITINRHIEVEMFAQSDSQNSRK